MVYSVTVYLTDEPRSLEYEATVRATDGGSSKLDVLDAAYAGVLKMAGIE